MKKFFLSLLKAVLYTLLFIAVQLAVTLGLSFSIALFEELWMYITGDITYISSLYDNLVAVVTVLSCLLTLFILWIVFSVRRKPLSREVRWHKMKQPAAAILGPLECGFGMSVLSSFVLMFLPLPDAWYATYDESMAMMLAGDPWLLAAATVLFAPIVEEVIFRGLVYTRLCRGMKAGIAALISAVIFGLVHGTLLHLIYTVPMGLLLCLYYEKYRSLWAPIVFHMSFNLAGTALGYYTVDTLTVTVLLLAIGIYLTVMGFLSMYWYRDAQGMRPARKTAEPIPVQPESETTNMEE